MKQHEAVILTLEKLGGQATLAELYQHVMTVKDCEWKTKILVRGRDDRNLEMNRI